MIVNSIFYLSMLIFAAVSFIFTVVVTKPLIKRMRAAGIYGIDVHKPNKPEISEMGGFAIYGGIVTALTVMASAGFNAQVLMVALLVISLSAIVGVLDDIMKLGAKEKPLLGYLAGIPLLLTAKRCPLRSHPLSWNRLDRPCVASNSSFWCNRRGKRSEYLCRI